MIAANILALIIPDCDKCWIATGPSVMLGVCYSISSVVIYPQVALTVSE